MILSPNQARTLMVVAQGLDERPAASSTKEDVLASIRRMGALQIDTISVVARSPYFALWSRLGHYNPRWLEELLAEGRLFEYWSHAASFLPMEDFPLYHPQMLDQAQNRAGRWIEEHPEIVERMLTRIRETGPVRSADFERRDGRTGTWWDWKPEKIALEMLFNAGILMIARRDNFHRVYDLRERVLPQEATKKSLSEEEARREFILKAVRALGIALPSWVPDYFRISKRGVAGQLEALHREGHLLRVGIEGWETPAYVHPDHQEWVEKVQSDVLIPTLTTLLSPFDPLVWDRQRARELFDFDYRIEIYLPAARRRHGYFSTPILHRGQLVGRLDPKAHRKEGIFEVRALHFEPETPLTDELILSLGSSLRECAEWHGTPEIVLRHSDPPDALPRLNACLST